MKMLIKENAERIYHERSVKEGTKTVLYITDFRKENTKKEAGVATTEPASLNNTYSWLQTAIDYENDPIGSFFLKSTSRY